MSKVREKKEAYWRNQIATTPPQSENEMFKMNPFFQLHARTKSHDRSRRARRLFLQPLETRRVLAGVCDIDFDDGELTIECDDASNDITITGTGAGAVTITANDFETLDGTTVFGGGVTDITVELEGGDDLVLADGLEISGSLSIDGGDDSNTNVVQYAVNIGGDVTIENGDTDHGTDNNIYGSVGQYNLVYDNTIIGGDVIVENGDSESTAADSSYGTFTNVQANAIGGDVIVANGDATSSATGDDNFSAGNLRLSLATRSMGM